MNINLAIIERARAGEPLTAAELDELGGTDLLSLGMLADEVRRARVGDTVTYARDAESRLTTLPATLPEAIEAIRAAQAALGRVTGYSLADVIDRNWGPLDQVLAQLKSAGLEGLAEAPIDRIADLPAALAAARAAGVAVGCLSLQKPLTGDRTEFLLALPSVKNIQVDWAQYGPKLAQVALTFGANDLDRVSTVDDPTLGKRRASAEEVRRNIAAAGFAAVER